MQRKLETDYLIIGAGAMGLAFADEIIHGSKDATVVLVDKRAKAGGHWNDAYPFVTLHQPALFYGVNSEKLGSGGADLVSRAQILAYDEKVLEKLKATGRLTFLPLCEFPFSEDQCSAARDDRGQRTHRIASMIAAGVEYEVIVRKKTVDATYMKVMVPATTKPRYEVASDVELVPINGLAEIEKPYERYVIVGAGKTGIDACLYLLERGVDPDRIQWIVPNDAWFLNRKAIMPKHLAKEQTAQIRIITESKDLDEILRRLESEGRLLRLDPAVWPIKYRCATVIEEELEAIRRIKNIVRMGRIVRIDAAGIELVEGSIPSEPNTLYVDCSANGLAQRPARPIFEADQITLQSISMCQQVFSAAAVAAVELSGDSDEAMNRICRPVPHPEHSPDFLSAMRTTIDNLEALGQRLPLWVLRKRLSMAHHTGLLGFVRMAFGIRRWKADSPDRLEAIIASARGDLAG